MKIPQAHEFLGAWKAVAALRQNELLQNWNNRRNYTSIIQKEAGCVIKTVAELFKFQSFAEYYHTDAILFDATDLVPEKPVSQTWLFGYCEPLEWKGLVYKTEGWKEIQSVPREIERRNDWVQPVLRSYRVE